MKVYQFKFRETFILDAAINEERFMDAYNSMFDELLLIRNISRSRVYVVLDLSSFTVSSTPFLTEPLLRKSILPPFRFLVCKN